jgi:hypothetical protein
MPHRTLQEIQAIILTKERQMRKNQKSQMEGSYE